MHPNYEMFSSITFLQLVHINYQEPMLPKWQHLQSPEMTLRLILLIVVQTGLGQFLKVSETWAGQL